MARAGSVRGCPHGGRWRRGCGILAGVRREPELPRWRAEWPHAWIAPALAGAGWSLALAGSADLATQRSVVFLGGPLVLLAGLHARLGEYLHGRGRARLAGLPVPARRHFAAGLSTHRGGFVVAAMCGVLGVVLGAYAATGELLRGVMLAGDFAWLCVLAMLVEPAIPALAAHAGRRFADDHPIRQAQAQLGGGWTSPEAAVHLYAPALGLGIAALLAMPGQLGLARLGDGQALRAIHVALFAAPVVVALAIRAAAPRVYAGGFFEAVAWLAEATRSLAGPPEPPPRPSWVGKLAEPTRMFVTQWLRLTPVPTLRLAALLGWGGFLLLRGAPPTAPTVATLLALAALWLVPLQTLARQRRRNAGSLAALPVPAAARAGRSPALARAVVGVPVVLAVALGLRWWVLA